MPLHNFLCLECGVELKDIYIRLEDIDSHEERCSCNAILDHDLRRTPSGSRGIGFPAFTADHLKRLEGEQTEITSLSQIRALEKKHSDQELCFEAFSFDDNYGAESPDGRPEKNPLPYDPNKPIPKEFLIDSEIE